MKSKSELGEILNNSLMDFDFSEFDDDYEPEYFEDKKKKLLVAS